MHIQKTSEIQSQPLKMLIYGESGIGKTTQVASVQKAGFRPLVISAENGLLSLEKLKDLGVDVPYIDITKKFNPETKSFDPLPRGEARLANVREIYMELLSEASRAQYDTIVFDTLTEVADSMIEQAKIDEMAKDKSDLRRAWGDYANTLMKLVYSFRDIPHYNVIFLCQEDLDKDEITAKRYFGPEIPGKAAKAPLRAALDIIYRISFDQDGKRIFQTGLTAGVVAKHRGSKLELFEPAEFEAGGLGAIMRKVKGESK